MTRIAVCYGLVFAGLLLLADVGLLDSVAAYIHEFPALDKVIHFVMYGVLALLVNAALASHSGWSLFRAVATGSLVLLIGSTLEEWSNILTMSRSWSLGDLAANYLGIICVGVLPPVLWQQKPAPNFE
jgi:polysaccharide biosynthesis protein VpsQ